MRRLIFWDFPRASWQYDLVVGLILLFIFATPREFFRDQPRPSSVIMLASNEVFISGELLDHVPPSERVRTASRLIQQRIGKSWQVSRVKEMRDEAEHGEVKGFIAYTSQPK